MSAQPIHPREPDRVPRNAEGIAAALDSVRRIDFYRELLAAAPEDAEAVLRRWWCEAMLDTDPSGDRFTEAALNGSQRAGMSGAPGGKGDAALCQAIAAVLAAIEGASARSTAVSDIASSWRGHRGEEYGVDMLDSLMLEPGHRA
ncbi:hypothetical protein SANTM175S_02714 [Streptomyces antimycoticus]